MVYCANKFKDVIAILFYSIPQKFDLRVGPYKKLGERVWVKAAFKLHSTARIIVNCYILIVNEDKVGINWNCSDVTAQKTLAFLLGTPRF